MSEVLQNPPFSFRYDGVPSSTLLPAWTKTTATANQPDGRTRRTITWTAPDGLEVRWIGDEYPGFTTLSWTVYFTHKGTAQSKQLSDVLAMDVSVTSMPDTDWVLRTALGSSQTKNDFTPIDLPLPVSAYRVFSTAGGRPTDGRFMKPPAAGDWSYLTGPAGAPGYLQQDQHSTAAAGATARFIFSGTSVSWIGPKNVDCGIAAVWIDGVKVGTVDLYAGSWLKQQTLFTSAQLPEATHVLEIVATGRKNANATGTIIAVDGFTFQATGGVTVNDPLSDITYNTNAQGNSLWEFATEDEHSSFFQDSQHYYQDNQHRSTVAGAEASWTFTGNSVTWVGPKNLDCGIADVYLDGVKVATVDLYATTWLKQQTLWTSGALTSGQHTLRVVNTGTKNASAIGTFVTIDAFIYTSSLPVTVDDTAAAITYAGAWNANPSGGSQGYINSTQHSSSAASASATLTFQGTGITWVTARNVDCGIADVFLDNVKVATVDLYATTWLKQQDVWTSATLSNTTHTLKIVNTGTKNAAGSGTVVPIDAFRYSTAGVVTTYNDTDGAIEYLSAPNSRTAVANGWPFWNLDMVGCGLICALGWPGQWGAQVQRTSPTEVRWTGGMVSKDGDELQHGQQLAAMDLADLWLAPNEAIRTALIVMQPWNGGTAAAAQNQWRRWMLQYHVPRAANSTGPAQPLAPTQANDYFPGQHDTAQDEIAWMNSYGSQQTTQGTGGVQDWWWIDAGWYQNSPNAPTDTWEWTGTWTPDPTRFPHGLKPVTDRARQLGMKSIIWYEPERVMPGTFIHNNYLSYTLEDVPDAQQIPYKRQWGGVARLFNFGDPAALSWASGYFNNSINTQGVDLYREDFNINPLPFWNKADPAGRRGITQARYVDGHLAFWTALQAAHPGMLIDTCASGGRRLDILTLGQSINLLRSDTIRQATANQAHLAGLTPWVPLHGGAVRAIAQYDDDYNLRSGMGPVFHLAVAALEPTVPWNTVRASLAEWAAIKQYYLQDFHLLTPHSVSDDRWMVWQFGTAAAGFLQAFRRPSSGAAAQVVQLRGLTGTRTYRLTDTRTGMVWTTTGSALAAGLRLTLPNPTLASTITYQGL
ncbi:alpha-galactosidase [Nakamurella flavida]|uniref:Alpha-galactosidase n=1 Tax=Nakamurella flavida TaxID=363630 RepID=A0A938YR37_9ACTN|nr:alpha-galactosidase [Nakamurella flavida]MBM9477889.1 alpha-galactosidase [Nakamurella flavida]MDP9778397.1 hypothetical protein [Nakamurella flavida]